MSDNKWKLFKEAEKEMKNTGELMKHANETRWGETMKKIDAGESEIETWIPEDQKEAVLESLHEKRKQSEKIEKDTDVIDLAIELLEKGYVGFEKLKGKLSGKKGVYNPGGLAAAIGRSKYGKKKFQSAAAKGKKMKKEETEKADEYERLEEEGKAEKNPNDLTLENKGDTAKEKGKKLSPASSKEFPMDVNIVKTDALKCDSNGQWKIAKQGSSVPTMGMPAQPMTGMGGAAAAAGPNMAQKMDAQGDAMDMNTEKCDTANPGAEKSEDND